MKEIEDEMFEKLHKQILEDTYNDYLTSTNEEMVVFARQIGRAASGFLMNSGMSLDEWKQKFKNHKLVLDELDKIE